MEVIYVKRGFQGKTLEFQGFTLETPFDIYRGIYIYLNFSLMNLDTSMCLMKLLVDWKNADQFILRGCPNSIKLYFSEIL